MKKILLLLATVIFSFPAVSQTNIDTIFIETFDLPSGPDSVGTFGRSGATTSWKDTNNVSVSDSFSYKGKIESGPGFEVIFNTDTISTKGNNYNFILLKWNHIAKLNLINRALIRVSNDGGKNWTQVDGNTAGYLGNSINFDQLGWFNENSYTASSLGIDAWKSGIDPPVQNSWWRSEEVNISGLALDSNGANGLGTDSLIVQFVCQFLSESLDTNRPKLSEGWYVDNLIITGSQCEPFPPKIDINFTPSPVCFQPRPLGAQVEQFDSTYTVGAILDDDVPNSTTNDPRVSGIDSGFVFYRVIDSNGVMGSWQKGGMVQQGGSNQYLFDIPNISVGDTVEYYFVARDNGCPNSTRLPDLASGQFSWKFWPREAFPAKCGNPFCGQAPGVINNFPWIEDFEDGTAWTPGTGAGATGSAHRGDFPIEQQGDAFWTLSPSDGASGYAWSIRDQPTATQFTGPNQNHTAGGKNFIYAEASQGQFPDASVLITPCINLTKSNTCKLFEFYYHFFGEDMGNLRIDIDTGSGNNTGNWWINYKRFKNEQQKSSNDPWRRGMLDLTPFNGTFIRIRFVTVKLGGLNDDKGDMAIDDFRIFEPSGPDVELFTYDRPVNGDKCVYGSQEDISVFVLNGGCDTLKSLPLTLEVNRGANTVTQNDNITNIAIPPGDTQFVRLNKNADMSTFGTYKIRVWSTLANDFNRDNDTVMSDSIEFRPQFSSFPFVEDFENAGAPGTQNFGNNVFIPTDGKDPNFKWVVGQEMTPIRNTGPREGYYRDRNGKYIYTESGGSSGLISTFYESRACLDFSTMSNPTLDFYYHTYGSDIDKIQVEVNKVDNEWKLVPGSTVNTSQTFETDDWKFKRVDLSSVIANGGGKVRIVGKRRGSNDRVNMAIDKIMIYDRASTDAGVDFITNPNLSAFANQPLNNNFIAGIFVPEVEVRNHGTSNLNNLQVEITVTPRCGPNKGVPTVYTSTNTTSTITPGNSAKLKTPNMNLQIPLGDCEICAYVKGLSGDNINFNDTACRNIVGTGTFDIDFKDDFDNCDYDANGFFAQKDLLLWELGTPSFGNINNAQSSPNAWVTDLDGPYLTNTTEILRIPRLDNFDTVVKPTVRFWQNVNMGSGAAGAFEANLTSGWEPIAGSNSGVPIASNQGQNFYFSSFGSLSITILGNEPGFQGTSNGWKLSSFPLIQFEKNFDPRAFRFRFESPAGSNTNNSGWGIDDFEVFIPPQNSGAPIRGRLVNPLPFPRQPQNFTTTIANTGAKVLRKVKVQVIMDPNQPNQWIGQKDLINVRQQVGFLIEGDDFNHTYSDTWPGTSVTSGTHIMRIETSRPNNEMDNRPIDDTIDVEVKVLDEFQFNPATNDTMYCNDFEDGNGAFPFITLNSETFEKSRTVFDRNGIPSTIQLTSWQKGAPGQFDSAASGTNAWMTRLDSNYKSRDQSSLFTPIFLIDTTVNYEISFDHWIDSEKFHDGGTVEVTVDGGQTWDVVGSFGNPEWFNTQFVTALDIIKPGWSDTTNGWTHASNVVTFDSTYQAVFRFRFESDFTIERPGWAVDNFCLKTTNEFASAFIGTDEVVTVEELVVGNLTPNPASHETYLPIYTPNAAEAQIEVFDIAGRPVDSFSLMANSGSNEYRIDTYGWTKGVYLIKVSLAGETHTRKLIIGQ